MPIDQSLLAPDEPAAFAVRVEREDGRWLFLLACDHDGALVPRNLNSLGASNEELQRHLACNRPPESAESIVRLSETARIPGNAPGAAVDAREWEWERFRPYHERIRAEQFYPVVPCTSGSLACRIVV